MRYSLVFAASAIALATAACQSAPTRAVAKLECPSSQGRLTLENAAADGKSCAYRGPDGVEVSLRLLAVEKEPSATLQLVEDELRALVPAEPAKAAEATPAATADGKGKTEAEAKADAGVQVAAADDRADDDHEDADVHLPGLHVSTRGDSASVRVGPIHIDTDGEDKVVIKSSKDVRMRGEALVREKRGFRATFLLVNEAAPYAILGYEAAGPRKGPLTVAVVKGKDGGDHTDDLYRDIKRLVRRNGGA